MNGSTNIINDISERSSAQNDAHRAVTNGFCPACRLLFATLLLFSLSGCGLTSGSNSNGGPGSLTIMTSALSSAKLQASYNTTLSASGGKQPYTWSITTGNLPAGLTLTASTGKISGTPTQTGNFSFTAKVVDSSSPLQSAAQSLTIKVSSTTPANSLAITTNSLPGAQVSVAYSATLTASNGQTPYTWSMASGSGSLPTGLTLAATTGTISGTPTSSNAYIFTVQVKDSSPTPQMDTRTFTMTTIGRTLDQYGGREDIKCATVTPYFHLEKINSHWYFCDPLGNGFIAMSVANVVTNGNPTLDCAGNNTYPIYIAKYGDTSSNWGWQTLKRITTWGFNSIGQDSGGSVLPWQTCSNCNWPGGTQPVPLPYLSESKPAENASINRSGYLTSPIKDEISGTNSNYSGWRGGALYDMFDPALNTEWTSELANTNNLAMQQIVNNSPYLLGVFTDDSDYFFGSGAGPDFATGHTSANLAWVTLITSPVQTYTQSTPLGNNTLLYTTTQNYSKTLATNPTTPCSISSPCSLRDYLWQKYNGNIASLNAAWGSNYSKFDSTGIQVTGEAIGSGNGSTLVFTHSLAHSSVSPFSILISVGGTAQIGDCPWFSNGCIATVPSTGTLGGSTVNLITQATSTINYATGAVTITFVKAPAVGAAITVNYIYGGWMAGGTGLMDEDGSHSAWVGTNPFCLEGPDPNYPTYFSCVGGGGANNPVPNANPALGADLDNWVPQLAAKYFKTMHDDLKAVSNVPYFGMDIIGSWGGPAYSKFIQGAAPYLDGAYITNLGQYESGSTAEFNARYQYLTQYLGDLPFMTFNLLSAEADSSMSCNPLSSRTNFATQSARGQAWYNMVSALLTMPSFNGTYPVVGFDWWSWQDFQNQNQGLVSIHDNAYDGHEAVTGTVLCSAPLQALSCGGEQASYGDAITQVRTANLFWVLH